MADFNILNLYKQVFDISAVNFNVPAIVSNVEKTAIAAAEFKAGEALFALLDAPRYNGSSGLLDPSFYPKSVFGTPIYEQIVLKIPAKLSSSGAVLSQAYTYTFPDWPLFDISPAWEIKKESIQGGSGTVKEYIQQGDFAITIRGFLINYGSDDYPAQLVDDFWTAINCQQSIEIESRVFGILGINNIVIESAKLVGVEGYMNIQPFELNCVSDTPIELLIKTANQ